MNSVNAAVPPANPLRKKQHESTNAAAKETLMKAAVPPAMPLLPGLLFRHTLYLSFVLGAAAYLWPPSWLFLLFLLIADRRCRGLAHLGLTLLTALAGFGCALFAGPALPKETEWTPRRKVLLEADIDEVYGAAGGRLRIVLSHLQANGEALAGKISWNWDQPTLRPAAGEKISLNATVLPLTGFRNDGQDSAASQWRKGLFWRVWTRGPQPTLRLQPPRDGPFLRRCKYRAARLREHWRESFELALRRGQGHSPFHSCACAEASQDPQMWEDNKRGNAAQNLRMQEDNKSANGAAAAGILPALLFGDRFHLSIDDSERLAKAGLAHSIALSGQHHCIAILLAGLMLRLAGFAWPALFLAVPRQTLLPAAALPLAAAYLWLGMAPASLCRAALMLACWAYFRWRKRPAALFDAMIATLACMTLCSPSLPGDIGALLSFSSVAGIAAIVPLIQKLPFFPKNTRRSPVKKILLAVLSLLACTAAALLATLPVVLTVFGRAAPLSFLTNLLWLPVLAFWVMPLGFAALFALLTGIQPLADSLIKLANLPCQWLLELLERLDDAGLLESLWLPRPHWTFCLGWTMLLILAVWHAGRKGGLPHRGKALLAAGAILLSCGPALWLHAGFQQDIHLRVLDVGQGQSVLVQGPGHFTLLIDGGGMRSPRFDTGRDVVRPVIANNAPLALDLLALSHPDTDHLRGLLFLARHARIGRVLVAEGLSEAQKKQPDYQEFLGVLARRGIPVLRLSPGQSLPLPHGLLLEVPPGSEPGSKNDGLALRLSCQGHGLAFIPGDDEKGTLNAMAASGADLRADVLIAPHHGSRRNISEAFIRSVDPGIVLASCGAFNQWRFPSRDLREMLERLGIPLHATSESGELHLVWLKPAGRPSWHGVAKPRVLR
ncbi:MAG: ComEC/Rec2 family competence protein [Desulfovibrionaceae bacterium]|nr:ComEC/Rec2 family competence protein [Desulfovibrionaceae bacterium]